MVLRAISLLILGILISGCAVTAPLRKNGPADADVRTFADIYRQSRQAQKTESGVLPVLGLNVPEGYVKPYLPVILPPRVIKVWVPAHILKEDRRIMVAGHWSFVMLEGTHWFIEREAH